VKTKSSQLGVPESIKKDLPFLKKIDIEAFKELLEELAKQEDPSIISSDKFLLDITRKYNLSVNDLLNSINCAISLLGICEENEDNMDDLLDDFVEFGYLQKGDVLLIKKKLDLTNSIIYEAAKNKAIEHALIETSFKIYRSVKIRCSTIVRMQPGFDSQLDVPESYEPYVDKIYPVMFVNLKISEINEDRTIQFVIEEGDLKRLINHLLLGQKELLTLKEFISIKK
jgi:hypothetical protein